MIIARFIVDNDPMYGVVEDNEVIAIAGDPFCHGINSTGAKHKLEDVRLLAPIIPRSKVVGFARTYSNHAAELGNEVPVEPMIFLKPNTAVVGSGEPITLPSFSDEISYEGELAVVIGRICKDIPAEKAHEVVFGYTVANDLTARDAQRNEARWSRAKGWDGSCPLGPWIQTEMDPMDTHLTTRVDGNTVQDANTSQMVWSINELIAFASQSFTLLPGDVILTGTPAGVGPVVEGQRIEVEIEGIGILSNTFRR